MTATLLGMDDPATTGRPVGRPPIGFAVVRGDSMRPTLRPGDRLLVHYTAAPGPGRIVLARFPDGVLAVKRATERRPAGWWLRGDNPEVGVDSRHRGAIPDVDVVGVVRARVWPWPRPL